MGVSKLRAMRMREQVIADGGDLAGLLLMAIKAVGVSDLQGQIVDADAAAAMQEFDIAPGYEMACQAPHVAQDERNSSEPY